ncbi:PREDICTED: condensin complex subunit 2 [Polistes canadensis]|uniref:condensin complex subunit 2 n=1 Tax=Polistes canadensis TaxID=91411 RepID=UPI000718D21D|nr:PREDICTED: condensin complex subunit 2 [Polistes canadensis]
MMVESNIKVFTSTSSPLRRKTIGLNNLSPLLENDDEAERLALRRDATVSTPSCSKSNEKRQSLGLSSLAQMPEPKMTELISEYIKLSTENKINHKNAFSLEMIDFMTYMVTKRNSEITNLQMASTSLDVCTKIYGYRVDGIYIDILKMAGAMDKQKEDNLTDMNDKQSNNSEEQEQQQETDSQTKKKKKKGKQKIISTENALNGSVEIMLPSRMTIGKGDLCSSDMLYQIVLPHLANSGFYHNTCNDIILDQLNETNEDNENFPTYTISKIEDLSQLDLCPSISNFEFLRWSLEDEEEIIEPEQNDDENRFHFDLDASVPSADEEFFDHANCSQMETDTSNKDMCVRNPKQMENIVDFRKIMTEQITGDQEMPEYSFLHKNINSIHWAGPFYWKHKGFKTILSNSKVVETCKQAEIKKKKEFIITYTNEDKSKLDEKFLCSRINKIQIKTARKNWKEEKITLPEDIHYDITQLTKLYLRPLISSYRNSEDSLNSAQLPEDADCDMQDKNDSGQLGDGDGNIIENQIPFTNDNLVTMPTLTNKTNTNYPLRAKKIDMHQLKKTIWKAMLKKNINTDNKEETQQNGQIIQSITFSDIYKSLPNVLSKSNAEALSLPIAIVSLLHLANEKSLTLSSLPDCSDIIIEAKDNL